MVFSFVIPTIAQENQDTEPQKADYIKARVIEVDDKASEEIADGLFFGGESQIATVKILEGENKEREVDVAVNTLVRNGNQNKLEEGETIVVGFYPEEDTFFYVDRYRLNAIIFIFGVFLLMVILLARRKGFFSILGLMASILVIVFYMVPQIYNGVNPIFVAVVTVALAGIISFYLAHGFNRRTHTALLSSYITLIIAAIIAVIFTNVAKISGGGTEEAQALQFSGGGEINLKALFLGGILISALGVLDDITTAQAAVVEQLKKANEKFGLTELYSRSIVVGKEHIASLVNTLAFAYVGSSLPLLLAFVNNDFQPFWLTLNTEILTQEIIQILVGSSALVISVPISSFLAAMVFANHKFSEKELAVDNSHGHSHHH